MGKGTLLGLSGAHELPTVVRNGPYCEGLGGGCREPLLENSCPLLTLALQCTASGSHSVIGCIGSRVSIILRLGVSCRSLEQMVPESGVIRVDLIDSLIFSIADNFGHKKKKIQ